MKILIKHTIVSFVTLILCASWQNGDDTNSVYSLVLKTYVSELEGLNRSVGAEKTRANETIYIINDAKVELPDKIGMHKIQDLGDSARKFVSEDRGLAAITLLPIKVDKGNIMIVISEYVVTFDGKLLRFGLAGGIAYRIGYDSKAKQYKITRKWNLNI